MFSALINEFKNRVISGKELSPGAMVSTLVGMSRYYFRHGNARLEVPRGPWKKFYQPVNSLLTGTYSPHSEHWS